MATVLARDDDAATGDAIAGLRWALRRDLALAFRTRSELAVQLLHRLGRR